MNHAIELLQFTEISLISLKIDIIYCLKQLMILESRGETFITVMNRDLESAKQRQCML